MEDLDDLADRLGDFPDNILAEYVGAQQDYVARLPQALRAVKGLLDLLHDLPGIDPIDPSLPLTVSQALNRADNAVYTALSPLRRMGIFAGSVDKALTNASGDMHLAFLNRHTTTPELQDLLPQE